jgi:hypothetical protein
MSTNLSVYQDTSISLDDFKVFVKEWMEQDNQIKKMQIMIKEMKAKKQKMGEIIIAFMCKYDIEDLNTKEGRIRCKQTYVNKPVTKKVVKDRLTQLITETRPNMRDDMINQLYATEKVPKTSLRRLAIT